MFSFPSVLTPEYAKGAIHGIAEANRTASDAISDAGGYVGGVVGDGFGRMSRWLSDYRASLDPKSRRLFDYGLFSTPLSIPFLWPYDKHTSSVIGRKSADLGKYFIPFAGPAFAAGDLAEAVDTNKKWTAAALGTTLAASVSGKFGRAAKALKAVAGSQSKFAPAAAAASKAISAAGGSKAVKYAPVAASYIGPYIDDMIDPTPLPDPAPAAQSTSAPAQATPAPAAQATSAPAPAAQAQAAQAGGASPANGHARGADYLKYLLLALGGVGSVTMLLDAYRRAKAKKSWVMQALLGAAGTAGAAYLGHRLLSRGNARP